MLHRVADQAFAFTLGFDLSEDGFIEAELDSYEGDIGATIESDSCVEPLNASESDFSTFKVGGFGGLYLLAARQLFCVGFYESIEKIVVHIFYFSGLHACFHQVVRIVDWKCEHLSKC